MPSRRVLRNADFWQRRLGHDLKKLLGLDLSRHAGRVMPVWVVADQRLLLRPARVAGITSADMGMVMQGE
jgi:hypothetical protein